ncbi:MAG: glycosyltransferase family 9 protein [Vampirovibrio sp.]|nr:glycosyltransferase family 9 protein [Vampirovibrio sp.]
MMPKSFPAQPQKILVMRYRFIGDTLLMIPFLRNLRRAYPEAAIDVMVGPDSGELLTHCPYINHLITFNTRGNNSRSFWSYVGEIRSKGYDAAFVLKRSFSSAALAFLAGIPNRVGFNTEGRGVLLTHRVLYRQDAHEAQCFLDTLREVNAPVTDDYLESWWTEAEESRVRELFLDNPFNDSNENVGGQHVLLHLVSSNATKQWPETHCLNLIKQLLSWKKKPVNLHCLGTEGDKRFYEKLITQLPEELQPRMHNRCGQTSLLESLAYIKRMDWSVGVDCGTLHMAAAVDVPVIALFGPSSVEKWRPLGDNHTVVQAPSRLGAAPDKMMAAISVDDVITACTPYLQQAPMATALKT